MIVGLSASLFPVKCLLKRREMSSGSESDGEVDPRLEALLLSKLDSYAAGILGDDAKITTKSKKENSQKKRKDPKSQTTKSLKRASEHSGKKSKECLENGSTIPTEFNSELADKNFSSGIEDSDVVQKKKKKHKKEKKIKDTDNVNMDCETDIKVKAKKKKRKENEEEMDTEEIMPKTDSKTGNLKSSHSKTNTRMVVSEDSDGIDSELSDDEYTDGGDDFPSDSDFSDTEFTESVNVKETGSSRNVKRHLEEMRVKLGLTEKDFAVYENKKKMAAGSGVLGGSVSIKAGSHGRKRPPPQVVVFDDPAKRKQKREAERANQKTGILTSQRRLPVPKRADDGEEEIDLISAKFDVRRFGLDGLKNKEKDEAMLDLLVQLGAKAPKRTHVNVKEHRDRTAQQEELSKKHTVMSDVGPVPKSASSKPQRGRMSRKRRGDVAVDGQVGRYKHGVQMLEKSDIDKIQATKTTGRGSGKKRK